MSLGRVSSFDASQHPNHCPSNHRQRRIPGRRADCVTGVEVCEDPHCEGVVIEHHVAEASCDLLTLKGLGHHDLFVV